MVISLIYNLYRTRANPRFFQAADCVYGGAKMNSENEPFWIDEPVGSGYSQLETTRSLAFLWKFAQWIIIVAVGLAPIMLMNLISPVLAWIFIGFYALMIVISVVRLRRTKRLSVEASQIRQRARERTGASHIGSAVHVAGHPRLGRDQNVVLALTGSALSFYNYESAAPLDVLPLERLQSLHTVVYDDERVPHIEVIDSAAQALQLTFLWGEGTCSCLFRSMREFRPIDWYHAIQGARLLASNP
jgi:hypothetical protein